MRSDEIGVGQQLEAWKGLADHVNHRIKPAESLASEDLCAQGYIHTHTMTASARPLENGSI